MNIGYTFPFGAVVLGLAPSGDAESYIVLAKHHKQYVTGRVYLRQLPAPQEWHHGTYSDSVEAAVTHWLDRSALASELGGVEWMSRLIRNAEATINHNTTKKEDLA